MTSELNNTQVKSREDFRKSRDEQKNTEKEPKKKREGKIRIRLIPIWIRLLLVVVLFAASILIGLVVGYGVIGDGEPGDALKKETWQHIIDIVNKDAEK
ncbi:DNA-directed RNA polymerase subunit beta [Bacillus sinesaloumensis]|uniref:DNA-directed RNA polymerase subunit beta n=1 Tax=Litchfieldia sinesaloumensis TaxID=1926280 RepID=UPI0009886445|nr:DNA-directed RNA polymerase subunit beta [Bacillus sinesaloumensis]